MIRTLVVFTLFALFATESHAQDYMDDITNKACACIDELGDESGRILEMKLGLCILNAAEPYRSELLKEHELDIASPEQDGQEIGRIIGMRMAGVCPNKLIALTEGSIEDELTDVPILIKVEGEVVDVSTNFMIHFSIKNENGRTEKYYWFSFISTGIDLIKEYESLKGKNVVLDYHKEEFFDPKIKEYRPLNIIDAIHIRTED